MKRLLDESDHEDDSDDSDDYDDEDGLRKKGKRKRNEKPKKVIESSRIDWRLFFYAIQVYANAKISNKGYDTSQFVSSFRKALVPIGNQSSMSFGSGNSEHVSDEIRREISGIFTVGSIYSITSGSTI